MRRKKNTKNQKMYDYIKTEFKKLFGMILIISGAFLLLEHIYTYGGIDLFDFLGHELMGIILIILGCLLANRWGRTKLKDGLLLTWDKIKYVFGRK